MKVNLQRAVDNLAKKNMNFLQPMYETIVNSLEANATEIKINIFEDETISEEIQSKITGFTIEDNGEGFTEQNQKSFLELWTTNKIDLGCKGSGRITWLNVFNNVDIHSEIANEGSIIDIPFNINYDDTINKKFDKIKQNKTIITFSNVTEKYYNINKNFDNRAVADIDYIIEGIKQNLIIKLFLLKKEGKPFSIQINIKSKSKSFNNEDVVDMANKNFEIYSDITNESYKFQLYYRFLNDGRNKKNVYYCANSRIVKEEKDERIKLTGELLNKESFEMLLTSNYLDLMVNDSRDDFPLIEGNRSANLACPLTMNDIKKELIIKIHEILLELFPGLLDKNKEEEASAIATMPYLAKYIKNNQDLVKTKKSLTEKAVKDFNKDKAVVKNKFDEILRDKSIDQKQFDIAVDNLSQVAAAELGEYILYRDNIIKALEEAINDSGRKESFIHNIFMPKGTSIDTQENKDYALTNMWLLDDKFMTFTNAYSDKRIESIIKDIFKDGDVDSKNIKMGNKRPDLTVFYNGKVSKDALVIEFKGLNTSHKERESAVSELRRNCLALSKQISEINFIWAYIITTIDKELEFSLEADEFIKLYTNSREGNVYYLYNKNSRSHIYAIDMKALTDDAFARNQTFLNILKNQ